MLQLFYKLIASGVGINLETYSVLLEHLLAVGNWRKYIEVITSFFINLFSMNMFMISCSKFVYCGMSCL